MRFVSLGSGSSGNAFLLETQDQRILFDCGVGVRAIHRALVESDLPLTIMISHEHTDHVRSLASVLKKRDCQVIATGGTLAAIGRKPGWQVVKCGSRVSSGGVTVSFIPVSHDAAEPAGFLIEAGEAQIALLTDLGSPSSDVLDAVASSDVVVLESNYDEGMLRRGRYPAHLKRRIRSAFGHLSNDDCAATLSQAVRSDATGVWLCHLSHNNNTPEAAEAATWAAFRAAGKAIPVTAMARFEETIVLPFERPARQSSLFSV
jgi:phosphoribosyl 1,2-cyclic phosphodiesterase